MDRWCAAEIAYEVGRGAAVAFMVLLVAAAALLALGREARANVLAEYAYYSLVLSVASMLVGTVLEPSDEEGAAARRECRLGFRLRLSGSAAGGVGVLASALLFAAASSAALLAAVAGGFTVVPGRPTYTPQPPSAAAAVVSWVAVASFLALGAVALRERQVVVVAGAVLGFAAALLHGSRYVSLALASAAYALLLVYGGVGAAALTAVVGAAVAAAGYAAGVLWLEGVGWGVLAYAAAASLVAGFAASAGLLAGRAGLHGGAEGDRTAGGQRGRRRGLGVVLLSVGIAVALASILAPRLLHGSGVYSLDTVFNLRFCHKLQAGDLSVFYSWRRPLYVLLATVPGAVLGCPYQLYDIFIQLVGLTALAVFAYVIALRDGCDAGCAGLAALLSAAFWAPFFAYAGLQTNLLTLPLALLALRASYLHAVGEPVAPARLVGFAWLIVGLMHPWSLAFYTAALAASLLASGARSPRLLARTLALTLPGWAAYATVEAVARGFSVGEVAESLVARSYNFLYNLRIFFWGTSIRGEILLPLSLILLYAALGRERLPARSRWLLGPVMVAFLAAPLPNARLLPRLLIDSAAPLLLAYTAGERRWIWIVAASSVLLAVLYILHTAPVAPPQ